MSKKNGEAEGIGDGTGRTGLEGSRGSFLHRGWQRPKRRRREQIWKRGRTFVRGRGSRASPWPPGGGGGGRQARAGMAGRFVPYPARNSDQTFIHAAQPAMPSLSSFPPTRAQRSLAELSLAAASGRSLAGLRGKPDNSFRPALERFQLRPAHKPLAGLAAAGAPAARPPRRPSQGRDESPAQPPPSPLSPSFNRRRRLHPRRAKEGGLGARSSAYFRLIGKGFGPGTVRESRPRGYLGGGRGAFGPVAVRVRCGRLHFAALL